MFIDFDPTRLTTGDLFQFRAACQSIGVPPSSSVARALELIEVAQAHAEPPALSLLTLTDDEARDRITDLSIRQHGVGDVGLGRDGLRPGIESFTRDLLAEARGAVLPELDAMVESLRPKFDEAVAPLVRAAQDFQFSMDTTSDDVIERADEGAAQAWRDAREGWAAVKPLAQFRTTMAKAFKLSPTTDDADADLGSDPTSERRLSYSVLFAAGDNWAYDGTYQVGRKPGSAIDWLALAVGGVRMNTPTEVVAKVDASRRRNSGNYREGRAA